MDNRILEVLDHQGRSTLWLAQAVGVSRQYLSGVIHGRNIPSERLCVRISAALGVPLRLLFPVAEAVS